MDVFWETLWVIFATVLIVCSFLASVRVAVVGLDHLPENPFLSVVSHDNWALTLLLFIPMAVGGFARGTLSPLPWKAFSEAAARHGFPNGVFTLLMVVLVELWLLWIPARSYVVNHPELDRRTVYLVHSLNVAIGLLLLTPQNPIYKLIDSLPRGDSDYYDRDW